MVIMDNMVLEQLYPLKLIERDPIYAFLLGMGYTVIGIGAAVILFPEDPAIVAVAFISLMVYPTISKLIKQEEKLESKNDEFKLGVFFRDHKDMFKVYAFLFLGILLVFSFFAIMLPTLATNHIFENQIGVLYGRSTGQAIFSVPVFKDIFMNNLSVLVLCFVAAFLFGDAAIFLVTWNASVWGTIFGNLAKTAALNVSVNPFYYFLIVIVVVFPHMMLEAFSYICSATSGGVISKGLIREKMFSSKFYRIIKNTLILFVFALLVLFVAVIIETYVLGNVTVYQTIRMQSRL